VFVFDTGAEVFVWIGKGASQQERARYATKHARTPSNAMSLINNNNHHHAGAWVTRKTM
jgi:hypothetical protein